MSSLGELRTLARSRRGSGAGRGPDGGSGSAAPADRVSWRSPDVLPAAVFLLPWLVGLVGLTLGPIVVSLYLSFTDYNLLEAPSWAGLDNYAAMLGDDRFWNSVRVTLTYVVVGVPLQLGLALGLAVVLDKGMRGLSFYRSVFYLPSLLGGSVAIAILWRQVFGKEGLVNGFLGLFGIEGPGWIGDPSYALATLIVLHVWTFGSPLVIFLAGLRQIPQMYYEAASMDGAGPVRRFVSITFPLLTPVVFFNLVLQMIFAFQSFTQAYVVSGGTGGPSDSTMFFSLLLYKEAFTELDMGYASAMAWFLVVIIGAFTAANFWLSKLWVFYDD